MCFDGYALDSTSTSVLLHSEDYELVQIVLVQVQSRLRLECHLEKELMDNGMGYTTVSLISFECVYASGKGEKLQN